MPHITDNAEMLRILELTISICIVWPPTQLYIFWNSTWLEEARRWGLPHSATQVPTLKKRHCSLRSSHLAFSHRVQRSVLYSIETCILSSAKQIASPSWLHETSARGWCTGKTQRDGVGRDVGGGVQDGENM